MTSHQIIGIPNSCLLSPLLIPTGQVELNYKALTTLFDIVLPFLSFVMRRNLRYLSIFRM